MSDWPTDTFDLEAVYDEQISPLMAQIIAVCKEHRMPMVASFLYRRDGGPDAYDACSTSLQWDGRTWREGAAALQFIRQGFVAFALSHKASP